MSIKRVIRIAFLAWMACCLFLEVGFVLAGDFTSGPHDECELPGITFDFYEGHEVRVTSVNLVVLLPSLAVSYVCVWFLFGLAARCGSNRLK